MAAQEGVTVNGTAGIQHLDGEQTEIPVPHMIVKRDGRVVPFDIGRIENALIRCFASFNRKPQTPVDELARHVVNIIAAKSNGDPPTVEGVQDIVEMVLQAAGEFEAAKRYILYRAAHAKQREERPVPESVRQSFAESDKYFPTALQKFQFFDKYSRFNYELGRRETWIETVDRSVDFLYDLAGARLPSETYERIRRAILEMRAMPSMRLLAMAGPAARRSNVTIYNCSYQPVESIDSFVEALIISMSGCGVGYSVESRYVENFPRIRRQTGATPGTFVVEDSAEGWAEALRTGLEHWFEGGDIRFDLSLLRPAGASLRTKGGRASGPEPLRVMLDFARSRILARQGSFLRPIDAHDMMCAVGNAAVSGGVRRCLPKGTRIHTERGAIPIEEVHKGDLVMTAEGYKPVTGWVDQGVQEIVEIVTESRTIFRCTPHHRVAVLTDVWGGHTFKYARDLTSEDRLLFITHPIDGEPQLLHPLPAKRASDHSGSTVEQPELHEQTAWFIGKFFADGYVQVGEHDERGKGGNTMFMVACHTDEVDQIERVSAWMEQHGIPARIVYNDGNWVQIRSGNRQIARWMSRYKTANESLVVPETIWRAPATIRAAFIAGLMDGDGCYTDRPVTVVSTVYEDFARDLVKLLATLGIIAEVRIRRPETEQGWKALWIVTINDALALQKAANIIGLHACGTWLPRVGKQSGYRIPGWMIQRDLPRKDYIKLWSNSRDANMNSATLTSLVEATHYVPVGIQEVRPGGNAHTYDIEVHDGSMFVAEGYLVHNTAMISLFDYDDDEMRLCKSGDFERDNSQRWNANNSAVWPEGGLTQPEFIHQFVDMVESGRGEPGIFNRQAALAMRPARRRPAEFGTNPSLRKGTLVYTSEGILPIEQLEGKSFMVRNLNGKLSEATCFLSGRTKPLYKITLKGGHTCYATAEHKWPVLQPDGSVTKLTTPEVLPGMYFPIVGPTTLGFGDQGDYADGFLAGWLLGDGWLTRRGDNDQLQFGLLLSEQDYAHGIGDELEAILRRVGSESVFQQRQRDASIWYELKTQSMALTQWTQRFGVMHKSQGLPQSVWTKASEDFRRGLIDGLFSSDGSIDQTKQPGYTVLILTSAYRKLIDDVSALLGFYGIKTIVRESSATAIFPNGKDYGRSYTRYDLTISGIDDVNHFKALFTLTHPTKQLKLTAAKEREKPYFGSNGVKVVSVELTDLQEDVWDISVFDETHCFQLAHCITGNCGEIVLRSYGFCNLSAAVARSDDTFDTLREKVEVATLIGTIQSMATHFPGLRPQWKQNCEEERLLGVDITGQMDSLAAQDSGIKDRLRHIAIDVNRQTSLALGINQSAALTCVKPSGNSSQLLDCSSGLHARWAPYYIRNVRVAAHSPIFKVLRDTGVPMDPENGQTPENAITWVIHFPVKAPEGAVTRKDRSAIAQCEYWLQNKIYWTEHNPSCFTGATRIITDQGLMSFYQIQDYISDDPARTPLVLGKDGRWVQATFRSLGSQEIWELVVERCGVRHTISTTADHLWPVTSPQRRYRGSAVELRTTRELPVESKEYKLLTVNPRESIELDLEGILHGITFGDGTRSTGHDGRTRYCSVALCNDPNGVDSRELAELFVEAGYSPNVRDDMQQVQFYGLPEHWKQLPDADESPAYLRGFVAGWFAADGHIGHTITISSVHQAALEWLQTIAPRAGLATPTTIGEHHSESGVAAVTWYTLALTKETLDEDFFLLKGKREKFVPAKFAKYWKVVSVRNTRLNGPVYCMEVTDGEPYFVLEGNILTHNCTITYHPDEVIDLMKWVWEHRDLIGGLSFLPAFDAKYDNMPYVEITKEEYERLAAEFPEIDFSKIYRYEEEDLTNAAQELACSAGYCEIDI